MTTADQANIRNLQIEKAVKGFALRNYVFKTYCTKANMTGDSIRWYQETAADLTATAPSSIETERLAKFTNLEVSWTRNTSYAKKYAVESMVSMEDMKSADIAVLSRTLLRLTRAVVKDVDTAIWNVMSENQTAVNINSVATNAAWDAGSGQDPIEDILDMKLQIELNDYSAEGAVLFLSPKDHKNLMTWLISTKGSSIPQYSSRKMENGVVTSILGVNVVVSNNVTADYALMVVPQTACTWYSMVDTTSAQEDKPGKGTLISVYELGVPVLTDPKAVTILTNTQA